MNTTTIMIIVAVVIVWAVAFTVMLSLTKKRDAGEQKFIEENRDKALLHLYCKQIKVDGNSLANLSFTTGKNLQTIVALSGGQHTIEGVFETTESIGAKTRNIKTENTVIPQRCISIQRKKEAVTIREKSEKQSWKFPSLSP